MRERGRKRDVVEVRSEEISGEKVGTEMRVSGGSWAEGGQREIVDLVRSGRKKGEGAFTGGRVLGQGGGGRECRRTLGWVGASGEDCACDCKNGGTRRRIEYPVVGGESRGVCGACEGGKGSRG